MADSRPSCLDIPSHRLEAYLPRSDSLFLFDHPSMDGRLNSGPSEFQGKHAVVPRGKQQTMTLDRR
jgi:hypothetical protein